MTLASPDLDRPTWARTELPLASSLASWRTKVSYSARHITEIFDSTASIDTVNGCSIVVALILIDADHFVRGSNKKRTHYVLYSNARKNGHLRVSCFFKTFLEDPRLLIMFILFEASLFFWSCSKKRDGLQRFQGALNALKFNEKQITI